jgi:hypothetical protein
MTFALGTFSGADGVRFVGIVRDERVVRFDGASVVRLMTRRLTAACR